MEDLFCNLVDESEEPLFPSFVMETIVSLSPAEFVQYRARISESNLFVHASRGHSGARHQFSRGRWKF